uniref:(northern house mosquito) hypothetical protein n=1 Tax=Culex pipiens TaxID=7175 RepID=A0A8D8F547_CULPI
MQCTRRRLPSWRRSSYKVQCRLRWTYITTSRRTGRECIGTCLVRRTRNMPSKSWDGALRTASSTGCAATRGVRTGVQMVDSSRSFAVRITAASSPMCTQGCQITISAAEWKIRLTEFKLVISLIKSSF